METTTNNPITVTVLINAPVDKVWKTWTGPEHIVKWAYASDDWHAPHAKNDLRTGGSFTTTMAAKDGSFSFDFGGVYDIVEEHRVIAYTLGDSRKVKITFESQDGGTLVTETFDPESTHPEDMQRDGWQAILNNFKKYTEGVAV